MVTAAELEVARQSVVDQLRLRFPDYELGYATPSANLEVAHYDTGVSDYLLGHSRRQRLQIDIYGNPEPFHRWKKGADKANYPVHKIVTVRSSTKDCLHPHLRRRQTRSQKARK